MSSTGLTEQVARLVLASDPAKVAPLDPARPLTIGRAPDNRLCLASSAGVSDHHAVVRCSRSHGWVVCDWQSSDGTFLEGQRVRRCRPLDDGDEIRLGSEGPVLLFQLCQGTPATGGHDAAAPAAGRTAPAAGSRAAAPPPADAPRPAPGGTIQVEGQSLALAEIRSVAVRSQPLHPHIFSWWLLLCLGGLLLLPFPLIFWPLQIGALAGWILLGSRRQHTLVVELRDGRALRHDFASRTTALAHRNGIRRALGQEPPSGPQA